MIDPGRRIERRRFLQSAVVAGVVASAPWARPTRARAQGPGEIRIGALLPLTGPGASYGEWMKAGAETAVAEINGRGGIRAAHVRVFYEDHLGKTREGTIAFRRLVDVQNVVGMLSSYSNVTLAIVPLANQYRVPVLNGGGQSDALAGASPFLFNVFPTYKYEVHALSEFLAKEKNTKRGAIVYTNDEFGRSVLDNFKQSATTYGVQVVEAQAAEMGSVDYRAQLAKVLRATPDVVFVGAHGTDGQLIIEQARELGFRGLIAGSSVILSKEVLASRAAEGVLHTHFSFTPTAQFVSAYKRLYKDEPTSIYIGNYYNAIVVFARAAQHLVDHGKPITGEGLQQAIKEVRTFEGAAGPISFRPDNVAQIPFDIAELRGGKSMKIKAVTVR